MAGENGTYYELTYVAGQEAVKKISKGEPAKGNYVPIPAAYQHWDQDRCSSIINLPYLFGLSFRGNYEHSKTKLSFTFTSAKLKVGPLAKNFDTQMGDPNPAKAPFFLIIYVDDDILVSRGRGGGYAAFKRLTPSEVLEKGLGQALPN